MTKPIRWAAICLLVLGACDDSAAPTDGAPNADSKSKTDGAPKADGTAPKADSKTGLPDVQLCAGGLPAACCDLIKQHEQALAQAKACTAGGNTCTKVVTGDLPCRCKTFVDSSKTAAIDTMTKLEGQWTSGGCPAGSSCQCVEPKSSKCEPLGGANKCVDIL